MSNNEYVSDSPAAMSREQANAQPSVLGKDSSQNNSDNVDYNNNESTEGQRDNGNNEGLGEDYPEQLHAGKVGLGPEFGQKNRETHGITAKVKGLKEEIKGTITRNSDLVQRGKERRTGELARKEEEKDDHNPFEQNEEQKESPQAPTASKAENDNERREQTDNSDRQDFNNSDRQSFSNNDRPEFNNDDHQGYDRSVSESNARQEYSDNDRREVDNIDQDSQRQYGDDRTGTNSDAINNQDQAPFSDKAAREQAATIAPEGTSNGERQAEEGSDLQRNAQMNANSQYAF